MKVTPVLFTIDFFRPLSCILSQGIQRRILPVEDRGTIIEDGQRELHLNACLPDELPVVMGECGSVQRQERSSAIPDIVGKEPERSATFQAR
jgi:hypothetical protein